MCGSIDLGNEGNDHNGWGGEGLFLNYFFGKRFSVYIARRKDKRGWKGEERVEWSEGS